MKQFVLLSFLTIVFVSNLQAQCSELFISKYLEGYSNNRAVEVYNPTSSAVDLSQYSVGRFRNGDITFKYQQLPAVMLQPYDTYLAVIDKRDSLGTCFEIPVWNGYQKWDVCIDGNTNLPIIDANGDTVYCVQYELKTCSGGDIPHHMYGSDYNDFLDLQGKADGFFNPVYVSGGNTPMYFNGNDAVALIKGTAPNSAGDNILDVVGVIGDDPGESWTTASGYWITKDRTLVKNPDVQQGRVVIKNVGIDTMVYSEWTIYPKNTFYVVDGGHDCSCDPNYVSTQHIAQNDFKIYPNPATANRNIMIEAEAPIQTIQILNVLGQVVLTEEINNVNVRTELALPNINTGIYLMNIRFTDNTTTTRKLMIK